MGRQSQILAVLFVSFFLYQEVDNILWDPKAHWWEFIWLCHLTNLMSGILLFLFPLESLSPAAQLKNLVDFPKQSNRCSSQIIMQNCFIPLSWWVILGFILWVWDALSSGNWGTNACITSHVGPLLTMSYILKNAFFKLYDPEKMGWYLVYGVLWNWFGWLLARLLTPPAVNINVAFSIHPEFKEVFSNYWMYFLFNFFNMLISLSVMEIIFRSIHRNLNTQVSKKQE